MALPQSAYKDREFLAVLGDEVVTSSFAINSLADTPHQDSVTGILLAGVGVSILILYNDPLLEHWRL